MIMNVYEVANRIFEENKDVIKGRLIENGFLFDDEIHEKMMRNVSRCLTEIIEDKLGIICTREEYEVNGEFRGIYHILEDSLVADFYKQLLETRYR